jgi:malate dehydrogenase (oxaloacetate-decarboxylating)(NADP+)
VWKHSYARFCGFLLLVCEKFGLAKEDVPESVCRIYGGEDLQFGPNYIIPKPFDPRVVVREAPAVVRAAMASGVARVQVDLEEYGRRLEARLGVGLGVTRLLIRKARHKVCRILFPEGEHPTVLRACRTVLDEGIGTPVLVGNRERIEAAAGDVHLDVSKVEVVEIANHPRLPYYVEELYRLRQRKGVTRVEAEHALRDPNLFGAMMVHLDDADALVTGLTTHYPDTVRPLLQVIPLRGGVTRASGLYLVIPPTRSKLYFLADCTVNIEPTAEDLAEIAMCAADTARRFDVEPRVAFLSYSNFGSSRHATSDKVRRAVALLRERAPELAADGEMQADTAVLPERLEGTYPFNTLKGGANVLVFPNLDSGSIAYKLLATLGGAQVVGPILMGPAKPVHVLQRDASVGDVVNLAALAAVEAQELTRVKSGAESRLMRRLLRGEGD